MSTRAPRHREETAPARQKQSIRGVLAVVGFFACATAAIWLAVARDAVPLLIGLALGSLIGTR